jgi:hypothetical protein
MILNAFTANLRKKNTVLATIIILALLLRVYKITDSFQFDYDQAVPADYAYSLLRDKKLSLIGQELSSPGFYLGPIHSLILVPAYYFCNLSPDCVPYYFLLISTTIIGILFILTKKMFNNNVAISVTLIQAISFAAISLERLANSNYFLFLSSIILMFSLYKYFKGKDKYLMIGGFVAGVATVNFNPVFLFSAFAFFLCSLMRPKKSLVLYFYTIILCLLNYLPLLYFNIRHNNILINNLSNFLHKNVSSDSWFKGSNLIIVKNALSYFSYYIFHNAHVLFFIITLIFILKGLHVMLKTKNRFLISIVIWPLVVIIGFFWYKGPIPSYYFQQATLPVLVIISMALSKTPKTAFILLVIILVFNIKSAILARDPFNYKLKKSIVSYIIKDTYFKNFSIDYQMPLARSIGYNTLFKLYGREPKLNQETLYIVYGDLNNGPIIDNNTLLTKKIVIKKFENNFSVTSIR